MYINALSSILHKSQALETTQMSIKQQNDKWNVVHAYNEVVRSKEKEQTVAPLNNSNGPHRHNVEQ